jgi:hypothetical protein
MRNAIGMLLGAAMDRRDGDSGIKGAILGSVAQSTARVAIPIALTYAIGWGVLHMARKGIGALSPNRNPERTFPED